VCITGLIFFLWRSGPTQTMVSPFLSRFLDHTQRRNPVGRTPLDGGSARRRDLYLKTHNTHNRKTSIPPAGFEPTVSARERPQNSRRRGQWERLQVISYVNIAFTSSRMCTFQLAEEMPAQDGCRRNKAVTGSSCATDHDAESVVLCVAGVCCCATCP
jgi:hypothetical protein